MPRVNIWISPENLMLIDGLARAKKVSRSAYLVNCALYKKDKETQAPPKENLMEDIEIDYELE